MATAGMATTEYTASVPGSPAVPLPASLSGGSVGSGSGGGGTGFL